MRRLRQPPLQWLLRLKEDDVNIFGIHWCMDETLAVLAALPFIGVYWRRLMCAATRVHEKLFGRREHDHAHKTGDKEKPCAH